MADDPARGLDALTLTGATMYADAIRWSPVLTIEKYDADLTEWAARRSGLVAPTSRDFEALGVAPTETVVSPGNLLTTAGLNRMTSLIIAGGGQAPTNTAARIGAGNSSTAEAVGQTDLQASAGSANRWFQTMDATFPTQSNGVMTFKATFGTADGNFAWNEWCIDIGTPTVTTGNTVNAVMLNRKVASNGTKASGSTWVATATITIS